MIKSSHLRIGNIVSVCYENIEPDFVTVLEPGLVHLSRRSNADNDRDIIGIDISAKILLESGFMENHHIYSIHINGYSIKIEIVKHIKARWLKIGFLTFKVYYIHQIQNLIFYITGQELFFSTTSSLS